MYLSRTIEKSIQKVSAFFPVLMLTGPRQVGKTTVLQACSSNRRFVSLDTIENRELAQRDPGLFLQRFQPPVLIDEVQYAPQLFPCIKAFVDAHRQPGLFWLTGSQHFHLMKNVSESLAGRVGLLQLLGFSRSEKEGCPDSSPFLPLSSPHAVPKEQIAPKNNPESIFREIWKGSWPALHTADDSIWPIFYESYLQTYIGRDIRGMGHIGNELDYFAFMRLLAARTGQMLNISDVARDLGISAPTAKSWLSHLVAGGLVMLLEPYASNRNKRVIKTPKLYFTDTGLASYLAGWNTPQTLENGAMNGPMFETWVIAELVKSWLHNGLRPPFFYYRDRSQREIDLIIEKNGILYPVEIKKKSNPGPADVRHFGLIESVLGQKRGQGAVICLASTMLPITDQDSAIPVDWI